MENKTLAHVVAQNGPQTQGQESPQFQSFNTFLTVYAIVLAQKFPDVSDLNTIDYMSVKKIADFSAACSSIGLEAWEEITGNVKPSSRLLRRSA